MLAKTQVIFFRPNHQVYATLVPKKLYSFIDWKNMYTSQIRFRPKDLINHLINKFNFSDVHWSMNAVGLVQSKWGVTLTLHLIQGVYTLMNVIKLNFISHIYTLFVHYLWSFDLNLVKLTQKKSYESTCLIITFNKRLHGVRSVELYVGQSNMSVIHDVPYA